MYYEWRSDSEKESSAEWKKVDKLFCLLYPLQLCPRTRRVWGPVMQKSLCSTEQELVWVLKSSQPTDKTKATADTKHTKGLGTQQSWKTPSQGDRNSFIIFLLSRLIWGGWRHKLLVGKDQQSGKPKWPDYEGRKEEKDSRSSRRHWTAQGPVR